MKPTLVILAAGLSSRYKIGLKQIDQFGPSGEILLDYAIYDAIKAGFGKAVFVIQKNKREDFERLVANRYRDKIAYDFAEQYLNDLPEGCICPVNREKPWGTGHAVWVTRHIVKESFAVINADDFYGSDAFIKMANYLSACSPDEEGRYSMVGYFLKNTLSDHGSVARGVCSVENKMLQDIVERTNISRQGKVVTYTDEQGQARPLQENTVVSMNFWGFTPDLFSRFEKDFLTFFTQNKDNLRAEFFLPDWINQQMRKKWVTVGVHETDGRWIGVTYPQDKPLVINKLKALTDIGKYPQKLF